MYTMRDFVTNFYFRFNCLKVFNCYFMSYD